MRSWLCLFLLLPVLGMGQSRIQGWVFDLDKKEPIPFVNIGIQGENLGTVSLKDGTYLLEGLIEDKELTFSMVGYESRTISITEVPDTVYLRSSNVVLEEVVVRNRKPKKAFLGNKTSSKIIYGGYEEDFLGAEAGVVMKIKGSPTWVNTFHFFISENDYDSLRFRVNVYEMDGEKVGKRILNQNVIIEGAELGWNNVNLEPYNVVARKDFLITLEWLTDFPCTRKFEKDDEGNNVEACNLMFSATLWKRHIYYRAASQGDFLKFTGGSLGFVAGVEY